MPSLDLATINPARHRNCELQLAGIGSLLSLFGLVDLVVVELGPE